MKNKELKQILSQFDDDDEVAVRLFGGNGTTYNSSYKDATYAHIDVAGNPGYFTAPPQS